MKDRKEEKSEIDPERHIRPEARAKARTKPEGSSCLAPPFLATPSAADTVRASSAAARARAASSSFPIFPHGKIYPYRTMGQWKIDIPLKSTSRLRRAKCIWRGVDRV